VNNGPTNTGPGDPGPQNAGPANGGTNEVEERLQAASLALTERFPDHELRPLRLPTPAVRGAVHRGAARRVWRRGRPWLIPLAAAAAVVLVVTLPLALRQTLGGHGTGVAPAAGPDGTPPYYVEASNLIGHDYVPRGYVVIRATATGQTVAKARLPQADTRVQAITAAADDRTFVLAVEPVSSTGKPIYSYDRFLVLSFDPASRTASLTPLSLNAPEPFCAFALSPDGLDLAVAFGHGCDGASPGLGTVKITVYDLATGTSRSWTGTQRSIVGFSSLSWVDGDQELAFAWVGTDLRDLYLAKLDTTLPGNQIPAASQGQLPAPPVQIVATPGGSVLSFFSGVVYRYTETGGGLRGVAIDHPTPLFGIFWTNATGNLLIVQQIQVGPPRLGVLSHGHFRELPQGFAAPAAW
jgi:hypothetical protein